MSAGMDSEALAPYLLRCRTCWNRGTVERWACETCWHGFDFETRFPTEGSDPPKQPQLYTAERLKRLPDPPLFPACGHPVTLGQTTLNAVLLDCLCPKCQGSGTRTILLPPDQAQKREERRRQRGEDDRKKILSGFGQKVPCGAMTRAGVPCRRRCCVGMSRCKNHGGLSTGPRTAEGRQRVNQARWGSALKSNPIKTASSPTP